MKAALTSRFETGIVEKSGFKAKCQRCEYRWIYCGTRNFACCPACHTSVVIRPRQSRAKMKKATDRRVKTLTSSEVSKFPARHFGAAPDYPTCEGGKPYVY